MRIPILIFICLVVWNNAEDPKENNTVDPTANKTVDPTANKTHDHNSSTTQGTGQQNHQNFFNMLPAIGSSISAFSSIIPHGSFGKLGATVGGLTELMPLFQPIIELIGNANPNSSSGVFVKKMLKLINLALPLFTSKSADGKQFDFLDFLMPAFGVKAKNDSNNVLSLLNQVFGSGGKKTISPDGVERRPGTIFDVILGFLGYYNEKVERYRHTTTTPPPSYYAVPLTTVLSDSLALQVKDMMEQTMKVVRAVFKLVVDVYRANGVPYVKKLVAPFIRQDLVPAIREFITPLLAEAFEPVANGIVKKVMFGSDDGFTSGFMSALLGSVMG